MREFQITTEYIELVKLLKLLRIAESGGQAKIMVEEGEVFLNGVQEFRKRAKLRPGDIVEVLGEKISIK
jgi:ribosome-associated protein